ncbi:MAG: 5-deoxy-glucuronate isomerase [Clostridiales bacterium]|jgi:5-deoxy-glucuronate isomerase|nr:5-deoxy-glucuronate isomerase [Clostridiales bacterium]
MFKYPRFDEDGLKVLTSVKDGIDADMLMDISVRRLAVGKKLTFFSADAETAVLLLDGAVRFAAADVNAYPNGESAHPAACFDEVAARNGIFADLPVTAHVAAGCPLTVEAVADAEILIASAANARAFPPKLYRKSDVICTVSCEGLWENTAVRDVNTIFDYDNAPHSNLVIGEVLARQGRWWSYVPHSHPQPEVYYYKFDRKEGFGAGFIDDEAHTVKDGSAGCFPGGKTHVQVTAPGYPMYCCWIIRHLKDNPWLKTRTVHPDFAWLENKKLNRRITATLLA